MLKCLSCKGVGSLGGSECRQKVKLVQAWRAQNEAAYLPASVQVGWTPCSLIIYGCLQDRDIFNPVSDDQTPAFNVGDVFEIFFRPPEQESYREFHITPTNARLQLAIPSVRAFIEAKEAGGGIPSQWFISGEVFHSQVRCEPEKGQWEVWAEIPFEMIMETGRPQTGDRWLYSFSRYDYTQGADEPILSSTSRHPEINFHRQQDWGTLLFCEEKDCN